MPSREGSRVFLGNIPEDVRERDIERFFDKYGKIRNIFIKNGRYGFCEFDDYRDADDAVYDLNGKELLGTRITVEHAHGLRRDRDRGGRGEKRGRWVDKYGPPTRTDYRVIVENLSSRVSWQDLKDLMRRSGDVTFANAHNDRRNEGIVEFASRHDMERAIEKYDDYELEGRRLKVYPDRDAQSRSRSRSRTRSRSRDRKKSRRDSRSKSRSRSRSKSRSRSRSKSRSKSADKSSLRGRKRSLSRSRSNSPDDSRRARRDSEGEKNGGHDD